MGTVFLKSLLPPDSLIIKVGAKTRLSRTMSRFLHSRQSEAFGITRARGGVVGPVMV